MIRESGDAAATDGIALGRRVAEAVLARGGLEIVASLGWRCPEKQISR